MTTLSTIAGQIIPLDVDPESDSDCDSGSDSGESMQVTSTGVLPGTLPGAALVPESSIAKSPKRTTRLQAAQLISAAKPGLSEKYNNRLADFANDVWIDISNADSDQSHCT